MNTCAFSRFGLPAAILAILTIGGVHYHQRHAAEPVQVAAAAEVRSNAADFEGEVTTLTTLSVEQAMEVIAPVKELPPTAEQSWAAAAPEEEFAAFQTWAARWAASAPAEREGLTSEGVALAEKRRTALRTVIETDPARALDRTVPLAVRRALPAEVTSLLETRVDGAGTLQVLAVNAAAPGQSALSRRVEISEEKYDAFVYGRREWQPSQRDLPLHGIALDGQMAVSAWPGRVLEPVEKAEALAALAQPPVCPVSQQPAELDGSEVAVRVGGDDKIFCSTPHATSSLRERATRESQRPQPFRATPLAASGGAGTAVPSTEDEGNPSWTTGSKRLLFVRVNFASHSYHDLTTQNCHEIVGKLSDKILLWSKEQLEILPSDQPDGSLVTPVVTLSKSPSGYSADDMYEIWDETWEKLKSEHGIDRNANPYDFLMLAAGEVPLVNDEGDAVGWGGIGMVYGYASMLRLTAPTAAERIANNVSVAIHEFGHNIGLHHAGSVFPHPELTNGAHFEYGDLFDSMGRGDLEFNPAAKRWLHWLTPSALPVVQEPGKFTIRAHDEAETYGRRGLLIPGDNPVQYQRALLLDYRTSSSARLAHSAGIRSVALYYLTGANLQDTTPETTIYDAEVHLEEAGTLDAPLLTGRTFSYPWINPTIHVTTLETDPEAGIATVQVNYGAYPGNGAPAGSITQSPATVFEGGEIVFTAAASDPNGDRLANQWSTGDGTLHNNVRELVHTFTGLGSRTVTCRVSDMKGKTTLLTRSVSVVANPSAPLITGLGDRTTPEDTMIEIPFTVSDAQVAAASITVTGGVYDPGGVITSAGLQMGSNGGGSRWVRLTPRPHQHGAAMVVIEASDGTYTRLKTFLITVLPTSGGPTPVASGSTWRYWAASGAPPAGWKNAGYADGSWSQGASPFTHGETVTTGTVLPGVVPRTTTYCRRTFQGPLVFGEDTPMLRVRADDGVVVYFNGTEIWRNNMPDGTPGHTTAANRTVEGREESEWHVIPLPTLSAGAFQTHTIAAEVHDSVGSGAGDVRFDLEFQRALGPVFGSLPNRVMFEDTTLTFTVSATDAETPGDTITFTGRSLHRGVANEDIIFNDNQCSITPQPNAAGIVTIVITASDGSTATENSFLLFITAVNDPPLLAPLSDVTSPVQQPVPLIPVRISDADHAVTSLTLQATSNNQTLLPNSGFSFLPDPDPAQTGRRWLRIASPPGSVNDATITVTVSDGVSPVSRTFTFRSIFQTPVNTAPVTIVGKGEAWSYWMEGTEEPDWTNASFDDSRWRSGPASLGYGLTQTTTILATPLRITTYFRRKFTAPPDTAASVP